MKINQIDIDNEFKKAIFCPKELCAPKELCYRLIEIGCKTGSYIVYTIISVFTINDFVGTHEQAKENARIVWGTNKTLGSTLPGINQTISGDLWKVHRYCMIDSDNWVEYLEKTMIKK